MKKICSILLFFILSLISINILNRNVVKAAENLQTMPSIVCSYDDTVSSGSNLRVTVKSDTKSVQYRVFLNDESTSVWEDATGGYITPTDGTSSYLINTNKVMKSGKYRISVWVKRAGINGTIVNSAGLGNYDNYYCFEQKCVPAIKLQNNKLTSIDSSTNSIGVSCSESGKVQYKLLAMSYKTNQWTDLSGGYSEPIAGNTNYNLKFNNKLTSGNYKFSIWVKRYGQEGITTNLSGLGNYDNYLTFDLKYTSEFPNIDSVSTAAAYPNSGDKIGLNVVSDYTGKVQYKVLAYTELTNCWKDISGGYSNATDGDKVFNINTSEGYAGGINRISVWVKRYGTNGNIANSQGLGNYDSYSCIEVKCTPHLNVSVENSNVTSGDNLRMNLTAKDLNMVQYRVFVSNVKTNKWIDASGGYSQSVSGSTPYEITLNKAFSAGNYNVSVWVKRANQNGLYTNSSGLGDYDSYYCFQQKYEIGKNFKICIDAGHGGYDSGAVGYSGTLEKNINLSVALKLGALLQKDGVNVIYTRTSDNVTWPSEVVQDLQTRCNISNNNNCDLFLAIHCNSASSSSANGIETYYYNDESSKQFANVIQNELSSEMGLYNRGVYGSRLYVVKNSNAIAALAELGFINNPNEENILKNSAYQDKYAKALEKAILEYRN